MIVCERPPWSRTTIKWHRFEKRSANEWILNFVPPYYATLFEQQESDLMTKSLTGWRDAKSGRSRWTILADLAAEDTARIDRFIWDYQRYLILGLNRHTRPHFSDQLDSCLALDYNFRRGLQGARTEVGLMVYHAKWKKSIAAAEALAKQLANAMSRIPTSGFEGPVCLSYVPPAPHKRYDLPRILTSLLLEYGEVAGRLRPNQPVVHPIMTARKPPFKELGCDEKISCWEKLLCRGVDLQGSVDGCGVYVIDDLFQSGATLWSYARHLKSLGATAVFGLVCEKSWGDKDNR